MKDTTIAQPRQSNMRPARDWIKILQQYREPNEWRSTFEIGVTAGPFLALWALAWWSLSISYWLAFAVSVVNAGFLLRLFTIQHDLGHGAFYKNRLVSDWIGRVIGVFTVTPYDLWKKCHDVHHAGSGNLDRRGLGDVYTATVVEYQAMTRFERLYYRAYRHPITLFVIGPAYVFLIEARAAFGMGGRAKYWISAMGTNAGITLALGLVWYFGGLAPILLIFLPSTLVAATVGVWLFYVQHQFEETHWRHEPEWQVHEAALHGSSHYVMPSVLRWFTANIGIHHVHHLYSRIPFYRLPQVLRDNTELAEMNRMTIWESFKNARLHLWDEKSNRLLSFAEARAV